MTTRTYHNQFKAEFQVPHWCCWIGTDTSWGNDACPSFLITRNVYDEERESGARLWVDHPDPEQRECGGKGTRFGIEYVAVGKDGELDGGGEMLLETDSEDDVLDWLGDYFHRMSFRDFKQGGQWSDDLGKDLGFDTDSPQPGRIYPGDLFIDAPSKACQDWSVTLGNLGDVGSLAEMERTLYVACVTDGSLPSTDDVAESSKYCSIECDRFDAVGDPETVVKALKDYLDAVTPTGDNTFHITFRLSNKPLDGMFKEGTIGALFQRLVPREYHSLFEDDACSCKYWFESLDHSRSGDEPSPIETLIEKAVSLTSEMDGWAAAPVWQHVANQVLAWMGV